MPLDNNACGGAGLKIWTTSDCLRNYKQCHYGRICATPSVKHFINKAVECGIATIMNVLVGTINVKC